MSVARWNPPAGCIIAARYLRAPFVRHLNAVHRVECRLLARIPMAAVHAANLAALPAGARLCPVCIAPARRDPVRVGPRELAAPSSAVTSGAGTASDTTRSRPSTADDDQSRRTP